MAFFGVFGHSAAARTRFDARASYLVAPALHFSLDGRVALCHDGAETLEELILRAPSLFVATASLGRTSLGRDSLSLLYRRYGKALRRHLPCPAAFALYDARKGSLLLGGTQGEKCYIEDERDALFFSSDPHLLRTPIPIDLALIK